MKGASEQKRRTAIVCWTLVAIWMAVIFMFSAKQADESNADSGRFTHIVASVLVPGYAEMTSQQQDAAAQQYSHPVRKTAHVLEYMLLGLLSCVAFEKSVEAGQMRRLASGLGRRHLGEPRAQGERSPGLRICIAAETVAVLYACTDEFHQLFVPGRSGMISDVGIDSLGALAGVLIAFAIMHRRRRA